MIYLTSCKYINLHIFEYVRGDKTFYKKYCYDNVMDELLINIYYLDLLLEGGNYYDIYTGNLLLFINKNGVKYGEIY